MPSNTSRSDQKLSSTRQRLCLSAAWLTSLITCVLAITKWGHDHNWQFSPLSPYTIFPVLGLLAFSLMWSHYIASVLRQSLKLDRAVLKRYFETTSIAVLILICLHPSLLIYQRFRDGYGLPPHSYESYVAPGLGWVTLLGSVCFLIFIGYELRRFYGSRSWWKYMQIASDAAMLGILYHALRLGSQLRSGWYRDVWYFYGITLVGAITYGYVQKFKVRQVAAQEPALNKLKGPSQTSS